MGKRIAPVEEVVCRLEYDGGVLSVFRCTPGRLEDLAVGWLLGRGLTQPDRPAPALELGHDSGAPVLHVRGPLRPGADEVAGPPRSGFAAREPAYSEAELLESVPTRSAAPVRLPTAEQRPELFRRMYESATRYRDTGGVHAAALFDADEMVVHGEDVGRHNAVCRVIGRAQREERRLDRLGLVLSARVSGEIALITARAGLAWIASRSIPTTLAVRIAARARMPIIARAAGPDAMVFGVGGSASPAGGDGDRPLGVVLAGGRNRRFGGEPKALERLGGERIIDRAAGALGSVAERVVMIVNDPDVYAGVELEQRPDARSGAGALAGVHTALLWAAELGLPGVVLAACDMPFVAPSLLEALWQRSAGADGAVPESDGPRGIEPLCAAYRVSCLPAVEASIERGDLRIIGFHEHVDVKRLPIDQVRRHGSPERMFFNVNTRDDLERARGSIQP